VQLPTMITIIYDLLFPQETFCKMIVNRGFSNVQYWTLSMGIVAIHSAFKPFFVQEAGT